MIARLFAIKILAGIMFASANELPNDCAIIATEANQRLGTSAVWSQVLMIKALDTKKVVVLSHALVVWQIHKDGAILVYDAGGTLALDTHSQKAFDIAVELNKRNTSQPIFEASYVQ